MKAYYYTPILIIFLNTNLALAQNAPIKNFEALWNLFDQNYASFEEKGIDWDGVRRTYSVKINKNTSDNELFTIFKEMLAPLNDSHVTLKAKSIDSSFKARRPSRITDALSSIPKADRRVKFREMTEETLKVSGFENLNEIGPEFRGERLFTYGNNGKIGYLRFMRSFSKLSKMKGPTLEKELDIIFSSFEGLEGIILDVRFNIGGDDAFSQTVAGRFVSKKTIGFYKQTRKNKEFGVLQTKYIEPAGKNPFTKPVIMLTNDRTVSAADVLCIMMAPMPNVTLIGEPSNGSYSDMYERRLPNRWEISLSNQRYLDIDKNNYEGQGTPVDVEALNTFDDIKSKNDTVLLTGLDFLKN
ncbi:S41 family peptidase [Flagellimonas sp. 389]|uniref:S41 family peptidase n=1 Tax=Flagellimonas sp. 389 TaxID=2835862 RepID=UPI001BD45432|nr:S41 family peptidase [Flagellimonas sp. 389]MBS9461794.1 S41 family peptidase [Flagellimonas sp. 389]